MTYFFHPAAEQDIAEAMDFYTQQLGPSLAERFLDEVERVAKLLAEHPGLGTPTTRGRRVYPLQVFPYSIIYRSFGAHIRIVVVRHRHRKPSYGGARR